MIAYTLSALLGMAIMFGLPVLLAAALAFHRRGMARVRAAERPRFTEAGVIKDGKVIVTWRAQ